MQAHPSSSKFNERYTEEPERDRIVSKVFANQIHHQDQPELKHNRELLQAIFDTSLIGMALHQAVRDEQGNILDFRILVINKELEKLTRRTDLVGKLYGEEFPGVKITELFGVMLKVMATGQPQQLDYFYPHDGFDRWFSSMFVKLDDGLVATNMDITERKQAEAERLNMISSQNQQIFWATMDAQEIERKRIAENLHNGLCQLLLGIKLSMEQLELNVLPVDLQDLKKVKQTTIALLTDAITEARQLSHELTPAILEDFGLKEALNTICQQLRLSYNLKINGIFKGLFSRLDKPVQTAVYRIIQELMMNIVKHAEATTATVEVAVTGKTVYVTVRDNGKGFTEHYKSGGIGLKTIRNKVKLLNGKFDLAYGKGRDTVVSIRIPYSKL